jgi:hypothetical protein
MYFLKMLLFVCAQLDSSVGVVNRLRTGRPRIFVRFPVGETDFSSNSSKPFLPGAHPTSYPVGNGGPFPGSSRLGCEGNRSHPSSTEVKSSWSYTASYSCVLMGRCLIKQRDNFTYFIFALKTCTYNFTYLPSYIPVTCS